MMNLRPGRCALLLLSLAAGCQTADVQFVAHRPAAGAARDPDVEVVGHLFANSWGVSAFGALPCFAGGVDDEGAPRLALFQNTATVETVVTLIEAEARRRGATHIIDLDSEWVSSYYPATFFFSVVEAGASATALRIDAGAARRVPHAIPLGAAAGAR